MKYYCQAGLLLAYFLTAAAQEPLPGTAHVTPRVDVELQPVPVLVPDHFAHLPAGLSLNLPPGFSARMYAAFESVDRPRFMAFDDKGVDDGGHRLASGIYLYSLQVGDWSLTRKLVLLQ